MGFFFLSAWIWLFVFSKLGFTHPYSLCIKKMQFQLGQTHVGSVDDSCSSNLILFYTQERQEAVVWDALLIYQFTVEAPPGSRALSPCNNDKKTEKWWPHLFVIDIKHGDKNYKLLNTTLIQSWREKLNINEVNLKFFFCFYECCKCLKIVWVFHSWKQSLFLWLRKCRLWTGLHFMKKLRVQTNTSDTFSSLKRWEMRQVPINQSTGSRR